jgi:hypothetical protein
VISFIVPAHNELACLGVTLRANLTGIAGNYQLIHVCRVMIIVCWLARLASTPGGRPAVANHRL